MVWFKVDDTLAFHQKTLRAGNAAMGLWVRAGSWCAAQLTDGFVPTDIARSLGSRSQAARLVAAQLWLERDSGYDFWQWGEDGRQPTRVEVEAKRKEARERQRRAREKANQSRRDKLSDSARDSVRDNSVSHDSPDPTRPDPTNKEQEPSPSDSPSTIKFDEFWAAYPKHVAKVAARRRWDTLMARGIDPDHVIAGAAAYALEVRGVEPRFVKQPDGWLNAGRWDDEPMTATARGPVPFWEA